MITPVINHYISLYAKRILLVQSVLVFDKNEIIKYNYTTEIKNAIKTDDILKIIHNIRNKDEDCFKKLSYNVDKLIDNFLNKLKESGVSTDLFEYLTDKNEQCLSVQLWDIASLNIKQGEDVIGVELAERYELELSAILSCYNEHFSSNELWKKQSANQVHQSALSRTDVLNDHQVLLSERVCVEISQVNYPELRQISAKRLFTYGYDSTSIFLWGYLVMVSAGYEICEMKSNLLHNKMIQLIKESSKNYEGNKQITVDKQLISIEMEQYAALGKISIEERHKYYINKGLKIRGLIVIQEHVEKIFNKMKELSEVTLAADTTQINSEINVLLKEVQIMNKNQGETSTRLSILSLILAFAAIFPLVNFIINIIPSLNNPKGLLLIFFGSVLLLILITIIILNRKRRNAGE